jgi:CRISPR-associated protein Csm3
MTGSAADFHFLQRRLRLSGTLTTRTALRIGSGGGGDLDSADLPVLKDVDGYPFVPGSSLKGALRSTIEALVRGAHSPALEEAGIWSCDPLADETVGSVRKACGHHEAKQRAKVDVEQHCAVCRLLGSHVLASHVRFCDALAIRPAGDPSEHPIPIQIRDGVAIDRDLKTVYKDQKYDFEVVSPGTRFALEVFVENPRDWLMGLLAMGFAQLAEGFTALGGFASRGLGRVDIVWSSLTEVTAEELLQGKPPTVLHGPQLHTRQRAWQEALAERAGVAPAAVQGGH